MPRNAVRKTLPTSRQNKFNHSLENLSKNYDGATKIAILNCKCSEPLPSNPYSLLKDHKPGPLKERPITSTVHSCVRKLSVWLAKLLNPLVQRHITSHLDSTDAFIDSIKSFNIQIVWNFGSLDIVNLYGSIPIKNSLSEKGLIDVVSKFFLTHKLHSSYPDLREDDFKQLLQLCLLEDVYFLNDSFHQKILAKPWKTQLP